MRAYSQRDLTAFTGATKSQITHWTRTGVVRADIAATRGTGHHREFSFRGLIEAAVAAQLHRYGATVEHMRQVMTLLRDITSGRVPAENSFSDGPQGVAAVRRFLNPSTREPQHPFRLLWAPDRPPLIYDDISRVGEPTFLVFNLHVLFQEIERVTGDSWPIAEIDELDRARTSGRRKR